MKSRIGLGAVLAAMALVATACAGSSPQSGEGGELVLAIGGADAKPGGTHTKVVDLWNEQNPDTPVRIEVLPDAADEQRQQQALELQAQGSNFDILGMDVIWTGEYAVNGWVESLDDLRPQIEEAGVLPGPLESATWEGTLWAAPYNSNAGFLYYRTDLIDQPPKTWDEAKQMAEEATKKEKINGFVGQGAQYEGLVVNWLEYFWGADGNLLSEDGAEVLVTEGDAANTATTFMRESAKDGFYAPGFNTMMEEEARNEFQSGKAVFMRNWPYAYTLMNDPKEGSKVKGKFDIAPLPTFTGEGTISALGGFNLGVSAFSDNKDAAKEFVLFASTSEEVQTLLGERTLPPVLEPVYEKLSDDPVMAQLAEILPEARPRPPAPTWNAISEAMQQQIFPAYTGQEAVEQAISQLQSELESAISE